MGIEAIFPRTLFRILGVPIKNSVLHTWIVIALLSAFAIWASRRFRIWEPKTWQLVIEYVIEYVESLIVSSAGRAVPEIVPYLTTMISFIAIANLLGLVPSLLAPTRDLNTTLALSLVSWGSCHYYGYAKGGLKGRLRSYIQPVAFMLPLNILSE